MFTIDELLSKHNQSLALQHLETKKEGQGYDGVKITEFPDYWKLNHDTIEEQVRNGVYTPSIIMTFDIINGKGKKREVSSLAVTDRFLCRLLSQKFRRYLEPQFLPHSFAYQEGKGILDAVSCAQNYMNSGDRYVTVIDIQNYFDSIKLNRLSLLLTNYIHDEKVLKLIQSYLYCKIEVNDVIKDKKVGIVQGNPLSPVLSNLYLHEFDQYMETKQLHWIRFSDDIHVYSKDQKTASQIYDDLCNVLRKEMFLSVNDRKSGIFSALEERLLGYEFYKYSGKIEAKKHNYQRVETYNNWHATSISKVNQEYHIIKDGVLNKQDYSLLFENDKERHHLPVESLEQINIYNDVTISSAALKTLFKSNIKVMMVDKYGNTVGRFIPDGFDHDAKTTLLQVGEYNDIGKRNATARALELAGLHNMRSNLRYYNKRKKGGLEEQIEALTRYMEEMKTVSSVEKMMLTEARARQTYYQSFNCILDNDEFLFTTRSKRPPKDEINALISFGNTLLYNQILQLIWKTSVNPQIGIIHASNRRSYSLNLDFADLFKPIIVDRVIFSLIHRLQIKKSYFTHEDGGVLLSQDGKRCFVTAFSEKLEDRIVVSNKEYSYRNVMLNEIRKYQKHLYEKSEYKPYKYY